MSRQGAGQATGSMQSQTRAQLAALATVPFIMVLGNSMLIPVLPQIGEALNLGQARVGLLITAFSLPAGLVIPWAGLLSDRVGRVTVIAPALILYGLGGLAAGLASVLVARPFLFILGARVVQGIGAGGTYQLALALAGDIFQSKERSKALGLLESANGLGKVVSPVAGAAAAADLLVRPLLRIRGAGPSRGDPGVVRGPGTPAGRAGQAAPGVFPVARAGGPEEGSPPDGLFPGGDDQPVLAVRGPGQLLRYP